MVEAVVSFLVERLGDLLIEEAEALHGVSDKVEEIQTELRSLQGILKDAEARQSEQQIRIWIADARELAYDASDVLESYILKVASKKKLGGIKNILKRYVCMLNESLVSSSIGSKIQTIKSRISELVTRLQMFSIRSSLLEAGDSSSSKQSVDRLVKQILEIQNTKRCLIVLDGIWANDAWDSLKVAFPVENMSTKILLTTRNKKVAEHVDSEGFLHQPQLLDEEQSW